MWSFLIVLGLGQVTAWRAMPQTLSARPATRVARTRTPAQMYESYVAAFTEAPADPNVWYIFPRDAAGVLQNNYVVGLGMEQVLGRYDLMDQNHPLGANQQLRPEQDGIAVEQCALQVAQDGTHAILYALGTQPTGYRSGPNVPWSWLQPGQSIQMQHYWKISLDASYPEEAVYKLGDGYMLKEEQDQRQQQQPQQQQYGQQQYQQYGQQQYGPGR